MDTLKGTPLKKLGDFTETDSEIQFLENLFNEDCKCESTHPYTPCSNEVTHKVSHVACGHPSKLICLNAALDIPRYGKRSLCFYCDGRGMYVLGSDCWIITPI